MEKTIEAALTLVYFLLITAGGSFAAQKTFRFIQKAALEKAAQGIPPLPRFR